MHTLRVCVREHRRTNRCIRACLCVHACTRSHMCVHAQVEAQLARKLALAKAAARGNINAQARAHAGTRSSCSCTGASPLARACARTHARTQLALGNRYLHGSDGFKANDQSAFEWFERAAKAVRACVVIACNVTGL